MILQMNSMVDGFVNIPSGTQMRLQDGHSSEHTATQTWLQDKFQTWSSTHTTQFKAFWMKPIQILTIENFIAVYNWFCQYISSRMFFSNCHLQDFFLVSLLTIDYQELELVILPGKQALLSLSRIRWPAVIVLPSVSIVHLALLDDLGVHFDWNLGH